MPKDWKLSKKLNEVWNFSTDVYFFCSILKTEILGQENGIPILVIIS